MAETDVVFRDIDLSAEARRIWGPRWNAPETAYEFSNGRKYELRTEDAGPYQGAAGAPRLLEDGSTKLLEDGSKRLME